MKFREIVDSPCGIRYCFDSLELQSGFARKSLLESPMSISKDEIEQKYASLKVFVDLVENNKSLVQNVQFKLQGLRDILGTLQSLEDGNLLDDIELFEIKHLALLGDDIKRMFVAARVNEDGSACLNIEWVKYDLDRVIQILDPEGLRIGTFYVYDAYSMELRKLRKEYEVDGDNDELREKIENEEDRIKTVLCNLLRPYSDNLTELLHSLAQLDIIIAKAFQMKKGEFIIPGVSEKTILKGMFHPQIQSILAETGKEFQKVDFSYEIGIPSTIIGANMGGKTVVLKTLTLCQYLFQFGFAIPASEGEMMVFDEIYFCIGDEQSQNKGLSSFAAEMLRINNVLERVEHGGKVLSLIDEPARTTNPIEGRALVCSLLKMIYGKSNLSLVLTTHYNVDNGGRCWRVKGLVEGAKGISGLKMDYSLLQTENNEVPHEAINIATELGISELWLEEAKKYLDKTK